MGIMAEISTAINQIDIKKQILRESFLHLQSQSPSSLNWAHLDSYFTSIHSSLQSKFNLLQTVYQSPDTKPVPARPELISFCQNSDGLGLKQFIALAPNHLSLLSELPDAYRFAPDAPAMVLDAMQGFYSSPNGCCKGTELRLFRSACLIMLEGLIRVKPDISTELKNKAMEVAVDWNRNRNRVLNSGVPVKAKEQNALGFLLLVAAYGLIDGFTIDELIDCFVIVATKPRIIDLCRQIIPPNNINDLIQKLINKEMHITAVNFSIQLEKTDEFPPVGLLEERKFMSMKVIEEARKNVKDPRVCNEVTMKEVNTLKSIIKCVDEYHLESEYAKDSVVELVMKLENEVENSKRALMNDLGFRKQPAIAAPVFKKKKLRSKKTKKLKKVVPTATIQNVMPIQEPHSQASDLLPDHVSQYHNYPLRSGPTGSYAGPIASPYGLTGASFGYSSNQMPAGAGPSFWVPHSQPPSCYNSNGWISE